MNKTINQKGFTLIEMLVVIAVIGILAATVLTSLGPARDKAKDTRIINAVSQARNIMEANYNGTTGEYSEPSSISEITDLEGEASSNSGNLTVTRMDSNRSFKAYSPLASDSSTYYCVDSAGDTYTGTTDPGQNPNQPCPSN